MGKEGEGFVGKEEDSQLCGKGMSGMQDDGRDQVSPTGLNPSLSLSLSRLTDYGITVPVISCGPRANPSDQEM